MGSLNSEAYLGALIKSILGGALIEHGAYWGVLLLSRGGEGGLIESSGAYWGVALIEQ